MRRYPLKYRNISSSGVRVLIDTHVFLWWDRQLRRLSRPLQAALADEANDIFVSAASVWELAIKVGNNKLSMSDPLDVFVSKWTSAYQLNPLPVQNAHALAVVALPPHHKDPFDRLLIAQAMVERMTVVTSDIKLARYTVPIVW